MSSRRQHSRCMVSLMVFNVLQDCFARFSKIDIPWNRSKSKLWNRFSQVIMPSQFCQRPLERTWYIAFCEAICKPQCYCSGDFFAQQHSGGTSQGIDQAWVSVVHLKENDQQCMADISKWKFRFIFLFCERCLSKGFQDLLKSEHEWPEIENAHTHIQCMCVFDLFKQHA